MSEKDKIEEALKGWEAKVEKSLAKFPERKANFVTGSNAPVRRLYTPLDLEKRDTLESIGLPGEFPYTRGVQSTMYRGRFWTMRQYAGFASAEESNARYKFLLAQGQTGLSVAFDLPTQIGYDSDHALAAGEVGKVGVAIDSLEDMETLFGGIPLDKVSTSMTINAPASVLLAMYIAVAEKQGVAADKLDGTIQNDILKEYVARGTYIFPPAPSMRLITDIFAFCSKEVPNWNTISISGYHIREAGSTAIQEVAFTLADGIAYVEAAIKAGLDVDEFAPRLSFFFQRAQRPLRGSGEIQGGAARLGPHHEGPLRRQKSKKLDAPFPHADGRLDAHRPAAGEQRRSRDHPGAGRRAWRDTIPPYEFQGRGAGPADRGIGPNRPENPADSRLRSGCRRDARPAGGFLLCRKPDQLHRGRRS